MGEGPPAAAFFDLDGTLVIGQTQALLVKFLYGRGVVGLPFVLGTGLWFVAYKAGLVKVTEASRAKGAQMLTGLGVAEFGVLMTAFVDEVLMPRAHPQTIEALRAHQEGGDRVVVLSAALDPVVRALCHRLRVKEHAGAPCEIVDGRYSGRLCGLTPYAEHKAKVAADYMAGWGIDPRSCWAYADHTTDLALLRSVGHPVAVHPKPGLLEAAKAAGWPVFP